jgi:hypothetical protein
VLATINWAGELTATDRNVVEGSPEGWKVLPKSEEIYREDSGREEEDDEDPIQIAATSVPLAD